ncbi:MAG: DUF6478 family protein [Yoonia sp.]|uniref:DUF6478 family protein n=1 Tax=Yoonia sp. TaxID=2212373 RepID=UPI0032672944
MARQRSGLLDKIVHRRALARWKAAARNAERADLSTLREQRSRARQLRGAVDQVVHVAESRLALPRVGSNNFAKPPSTKWSWRPALWRGPISPRGATGLRNGDHISDDIKVFHDCKVSEMTLRQIRNTREGDLAPFGLEMDVLGFDGSFLSVAIDLPADAADGLRKRDIVRVQGLIRTERPATVFARLNIKCGPNTENLVQELPLLDREVSVDFDLAYADLNENRIDGMWLDLIIEDPAMNQLRIRDLTFCRYPRADL